MKNSLILFIAILGFFTTACSDDDQFDGSGVIVTQTRNVSSFDEVFSEGVAQVNITQDSVQSVRVSADDNIINRVETNVSNNRLTISLEDGSYDDVSIVVNISMLSLDRLENSGAGNMDVINFDCKDNVNVRNEGSGTINMSGSVNTLELKNEGSGFFNGFDFISVDANIKNIGSGDCRVFCSQNLDVDIEGSGDVYYKGMPQINVDVAGSGSVINAN